MTKVQDYIGKKFGFLTLESEEYIAKNNRKYYKCRCDCGNECYVKLSDLLSKHSKSCGKCHLLRDFKSAHIIGQQFGKLTTVSPVGEDSHKRAVWLFKCSCGNSYIGPLYNVKNGNTKSCGCGKHQQAVNALDLVGQTFNRLTVVSKDRVEKGVTYWKCRCSCGNEVVKTTGALRSKNVQSCGCLVDDIQSKSSYNYKWAHDVRQLHECCVKCGSTEHLHAHHIYPKNQYPNRKLDTLNGVPLCGKCHREFHHLYGHKCTLKNLADYVGMNENVYKAVELIMNHSSKTSIAKAIWYLNKYKEMGIIDLGD